MKSMKEIRLETDKKIYPKVKRDNPHVYENIAAFASTFGAQDERISLQTRYMVERFCMGLVYTKEPS